MHVQQVRVRGENFVGLLGMSSDKYALLSSTFPKVSTLKVPAIRLTLYGTNLVGIFCAGNSNGLLLPYFIPDSEVSWLKKSLLDAGADVAVEKIGDKSTALGNLIACNDKAALVSPLLSETKKIADALNVEVVHGDLAGHDEVGACCVATNKGFITHPDATDEADRLKEIFGVAGMPGSVNFGFPFVKSGLIANSKGYVTGFRTTGVELGRIDDALGLMD
jgi:translation initiation factor 6